MYTIYALLDPRDSQVRYVGVTRQPLKRRLHGHIARSTESTSAWVKELRALSLRPSIVPLEVRQTDDRAADA